jgi:hypothetical protein
MTVVRKYLGIAVAALLCAACAAPQMTKLESSGLPRPGAKVVIESVENASGQSPVADIDQRMREALVEALRKEDLLAAEPAGATDLRLAVRITRYEPGNAFKRWVLPGWGSTVLGIGGELKDAQSGRTLATVDSTSTVGIGGLYTVGAWSTIFARCAQDLAKDLKTRISSGGDFVVGLASRADRAAATAPPQADAISVGIGTVQDERAEQGRIGERFAAFGVKMSDVYPARAVPDYFREALIDEVQLHGRRIAGDAPDVDITPKLGKWWLSTQTTALYWDITAQIECDLEFHPHGAGTNPIVRHYSGNAGDRTYVYPSAALMTRIMNAGLDELFAKIAADPVWQSFQAATPKH